MTFLLFSTLAFSPPNVTLYKLGTYTCVRYKQVFHYRLITACYFLTLSGSLPTTPRSEIEYKI